MQDVQDKVWKVVCYVEGRGGLATKWCWIGQPSALRKFPEPKSRRGPKQVQSSDELFIFPCWEVTIDLLFSNRRTFINLPKVPLGMMLDI